MEWNSSDRRVVIEIRREDHRSLPAYASVPNAFDVSEVIDIAATGPDYLTLPVRAVRTSWEKNYDAILGNDPASWSSQFEVPSWIFLAAYVGESRVGGAIVVAEPLAIAQLDGRKGAAVLWDLRVAPAFRCRGIGRRLLAAAENAAGVAGCESLDVETQNINVAACRLYGANGYVLTRVVPNAYPEALHETLLLWSKQLGADMSVGSK